MGGHMMLYRGSLKSCNYRCSYCPFSKHPVSGRELKTDKRQWLFFLEEFEKCREAMDFRALMVVPYGEALIHPWYPRGLAHISSLLGMDAVGAQTNLSFSVPEFLACFEKAGGRTEKLRLWATFHPEMTTILEFVEKCRQLKEAGVALCAGAVGVPENAELIRELRQALPEEIYLWINKMDGLKRRYTPKEEKLFSDIDPYFFRELLPVPADRTKCEGRLFVEGCGRIHTCNISGEMEVSFHEWEKTSIPEPFCTRKRCSCFLAYGGREDFLNKMLFGAYPLFRIPRHPKAVFLDVDGTLFPKSNFREASGAASLKDGGGEVPADVLAGLKALSREKTRLFFATTLPYREAMKRCRNIRHLFQGGIFAAGAHIVWEENSGGHRENHLELNFDKEDKKREHIYFLSACWLTRLAPFKQEFSYRILTCLRKGRLYKITLLRPLRRPWSGREAEALFGALPDAGKEEVRYFIEGSCMQIVSAKADKAKGVKTLCEWLGISPKEAFAAGDAKEDEEMIKLCEDARAYCR